VDLVRLDHEDQAYLVTPAVPIDEDTLVYRIEFHTVIPGD
jgi:hypothetical protein